MSSNTTTATTASSSGGKSDTTPFLVGPAGKRELRNALKATTDPATTISEFQKSHSLHSMMAKAFGTVPMYKHKNTRNAGVVETLDTDSVMTFLSHLNVRQYDVHKRISDTLLKQLEEEIRNTSSEEPLLELLKTCWFYATTIPELRPVLWAVLRKLGPKTPHAVLIALCERDTQNSNDNQQQQQPLKHTEIFKPLPALLKRLCWEADWDNRMSSQESALIEPQEFLQQAEQTLFYETIQGAMEEYLTNPVLVDSANRPFVASVSERRVLTNQRRALTKQTESTPQPQHRSAHHQHHNIPPRLTSGKAVSRLRVLLSDAGSGATSSSNTASTATTAAHIATSSYRPKLLHAVLSLLMARHGNAKDTPFLGGAKHLHCTLVADLLLSAGGNLPKAYTHLLSLARVVDESVQEGDLNNVRLSQIQAHLKLIFQSGEQEDKTNATGSTQPAKTAAEPDAPTTAVKRHLNRLISAGLASMKETDPQHLFLNPVTDAIAPGYSKIISKPMCIVMMEQKVAANEYNSITDWEADVKLMFKNCIDYNKGASGQWFRGEANRQGKVFREEIFPYARRMYQNELAKRTVIGEDGSRKRKEEQGPEITPLPASSSKKRKKDRDEIVPSVPALATMLLSDPFFVRIVLARILRELQHGVIEGSSIPAAHCAIPSLLQILHITRWSTQTCAIRGKKYFIPGAGLDDIDEETSDPVSLVSYASLRRLIPLLLRLFLEAELDRRVAQGGDLYLAAQSSSSMHIPTLDYDDWNADDQMEVAAALVEGALVRICQPGNRNEASLSVTFPKFATALVHVSFSLLKDRGFFLCLTTALLRHKTKLTRTNRDAVVEAWLNWLRLNRKDEGSATSAAHECLIFLLNEWSSLGNVILPRDKLIDFSSKAVEATNSSETKNERKFAMLWKSGSSDFAAIKKQYERMLKLLPESAAEQWRTEKEIVDDAGLESELPVDTSSGNT
jgi:hypothetical protein